MKICHGVNARKKPTSEVVLGLTNIHPIAFKRVSIQPLVPDYQGEGFFLNRGRPELNAFQHSRAEHIDASIDLVANKCLQPTLRSGKLV